MVYAEHLPTFCESGTLVHASQRVTMGLASDKSLRLFGSGGFSFSDVLPQFTAGGIKHGLCDSPGGGVIQPCSWLPADFAQGPFPFGDCAMCPFTVISHSCEYDYVESRVFKASHQNWGWSLGSLESR